MATKNGTPRVKEQVSQLRKLAVEERVRTTDHSDPYNREQENDGSRVFDRDAQVTVEKVVYSLYTIRRLAIRAINELPRKCGDAATFCYAIKQMALLHGKELDQCVERVTGAGAGCFDDDYIDAEA